MTRPNNIPDRDTADTLRTLAQSDYWRNQPVGRIARMVGCNERQVALAMKRRVRASRYRKPVVPA